MERLASRQKQNCEGLAVAVGLSGGTKPETCNVHVNQCILQKLFKFRSSAKLVMFLLNFSYLITMNVWSLGSNCS